MPLSEDDIARAFLKSRTGAAGRSDPGRPSVLGADLNLRLPACHAVGVTLRHAGLGIVTSIVLLSCTPSKPWRAMVVEVSGQRVCTVPDKGEKDPGWAKPLCLEDGLVDHDRLPLTVSVGECVEIHNHHPVFFVHKGVPCSG